MGDKVRVQMKQVDGMTLIAKANSNHWIVMDAAEVVGGHDAGVRPMELLLIGLAGCTGMDVISILGKMRVEYDEFRVEIEAEKSDEHPKVYTSIHIKYRIWGDVPEDKLKTAIELSREKYCSVSAMLGKAAPITHEYEIIR